MIHNLSDLNDATARIDNSFSSIREHCALLNNLVPNLKYRSRKSITKQNMNEIINSLENICNFPPIKTMRDKFSKEHNYEIVGEIVTKSVT